MDTKTLISLSTGAETKTQKGEARWPHADFGREKDNLYVGSIEKAICILYAFGKGRSELRLNEIARTLPSISMLKSRLESRYSIIRALHTS